MANELVPYGEYWPEPWEPRRAVQQFDRMVIAGAVGTAIGIVTNSRPVFAVSAALVGAGLVGRLILTLFGYPTLEQP